ncbi:MAG: leucine-rich repeat domain-containing protein [Verrucomicrobiota bacterium]
MAIIVRRLLMALLLVSLPMCIQAQFTFTTNQDGTLSISKYTGSDRTVIIPSETNGIAITQIGNNAFLSFPPPMSQNLSPTNVLIPNSIVSIGSNAFAFGALASIAIPSSVTNIGTGIFAYCSKLLNIEVSSDNQKYSSIDGALLNKSKTQLVAFPGGVGGSYVVPDTITNIEDAAFAGNILILSVSMPTGVMSIGNSAFDGCKNLTNIFMPNSVVNIGSYAFHYCLHLSNVTIPSGVTNIAEGTFKECYGLTSVIFSTNVTSIGLRAFEYSSIYNLVIPSSVTTIGEGAFEISSLTNIIIPGSVTNIGMAAFQSCPYLVSVYFTGDAPNAGYAAFDMDYSATIYYLPRTSGWSSTFSGRPALCWNPKAQADGSFGIQNNQFGFNITGTTNIPIVVEACTNLANAVWSPLQSCLVTNGSIYFRDPQYSNYPSRIYRFRSP